MLCTGDRGLCGGYNNFAIKKCEQRVKELEEQGVKCKLILIGKKANTYFKKTSSIQRCELIQHGPIADDPRSASSCG